MGYYHHITTRYFLVDTPFFSMTFDTFFAGGGVTQAQTESCLKFHTVCLPHNVYFSMCSGGDFPDFRINKHFTSTRVSWDLILKIKGEQDLA